MRKVLMLFVAAAMLLSAGCATKPVQTGAAGSRPKIAVVPKTLAAEYWVNFKQGAEAAGRELGADVLVQAPEKATDIDAQIRLVEDIIQKGEAKYLVLAPIDSKALAPVVEKAQQAGITVVNADTRLSGATPATFIGVDNKTLAKTVADYVASFTRDKLAGKANLVILEGTPGAGTAVDRQDGFMEVLKANPGITVLASQTAKYSRSEAVKVTEDMLTRFPKIDIILAANDEMALGAMQAVEARKLTGIHITGINAQKESVQAVKDGKLLMTLYANEYGMGHKAVEVAYKLATGGEKPPAEIIGKTGTIVDGKNVGDLKLEKEFR